MSQVSGPPSGVTRNKPIQDRLFSILAFAADAAGIEQIIITSGGQDRKGHGTRRTGSTRHDIDASGKGGAADLQMKKAGRLLNFENLADRAIIARFITECFRRGCTGIGAGVGYMGLYTIHVGFGPVAVWGAGGKSANAPAWLRAAQAAASGAAPASPARARTLREGDEGDDVKELQRKLGVKDDGKFGNRTDIAVRAAQTAHGLKPDGVVGKDTRAALGL